MFRKIITSVLALTLISAALTSCGNTSQTISVKNESDENQIKIITGRAVTEAENYQKPDIGNGHTNESLDLKAIASSAAAEMMTKGYDLESVSIDAPTDLNYFFNIIIVANNAPEDENDYIKWCNEALTLLNEYAIKQDPEYTPASENYYGGLFDQYEAVLTATCKEDAIKMWAVYQTIEPGTHTPVVISNTEFDFSMLN